MELLLKRTKRIKDAIHGELTNNGALICFTLEREGVEIPTGRYKLSWYDSPAMGYKVPLLLDVPNRTYIEIHKGNWPKDSEGCILVGMVQCHGYIERSNAAFEALTAKLEEAPSYITVSEV